MLTSLNDVLWNSDRELWNTVPVQKTEPEKIRIEDCPGITTGFYWICLRYNIQFVSDLWSGTYSEAIKVLRQEYPQEFAMHVIQS